MRHLIECGLHADLGDAAAETVEKALSVVGHVANLRVEPMAVYTLNISLKTPSSVNRAPSS